MTPVPDGQREKRETGAAAGIARCLLPAASRERRRRRRAKGPVLGWAGPEPPLPGRREMERAGRRWRVRPCAGPPARPSSRRRGSVGPMRKCSAVSRGPRRPLPATSCWGWGGGAPLPRPHRLSAREVAAAARPLSVLRSLLRVPLPEGVAPLPPAQTWSSLIVISTCWARVEGRDFARGGARGARAAGVWRRFESKATPRAV